MHNLESAPNIAIRAVDSRHPLIWQKTLHSGNYFYVGKREKALGTQEKTLRLMIERALGNYSDADNAFLVVINGKILKKPPGSSPTGCVPTIITYFDHEGVLEKHTRKEDHEGALRYGLSNTLKPHTNSLDFKIFFLDEKNRAKIEREMRTNSGSSDVKSVEEIAHKKIADFFFEKIIREMQARSKTGKERI